MEGNRGDTTQVLTFRVGREVYGCALGSVREVVQVLPITRVPTTPACLRGVMRLRERAIPVVDLGVKFGEAEAEFTRWSCVIVLELQADGAPLTVGVLADRVQQVVELGPDELQPAPELGMRVRVEFLAGLARAGDRLVPLLDLGRVLSTAELAAAAQVELPPAPPPNPSETP